MLEILSKGVGVLDSCPILNKWCKCGCKGIPVAVQEKFDGMNTERNEHGKRKNQNQAEDQEAGAWYAA